MRQQIVPFFDLCTGCRICELACSQNHFRAYAPRKAHVAVSIESEGLRAQPSICIQCDDAPCVRVCPVDAIDKDDKLGAVLINRDKCTGCKMCVLACPIDAIYFDTESKKATKCDLCQGEPACVKYCPTKALALVKTR